jgi:hypothetical protein
LGRSVARYRSIKVWQHASVTDGLDDPGERAAIAIYVHKHSVVGDETHLSTFRALLRDARMLAGRNLDTGDPESEPIADWPAALLYLILLDQIGRVIRPADATPTSVTTMTETLKRFAPSLTERDHGMLYALRNAFAHEYALTNQHSTDARKQHRFQLTLASDPLLADYRGGPWNGKFGDESEGGPTEVNLTYLGTVVEGVVSEIEKRCDDGALRLVDGVTPAMVYQRYGFRVLPPHKLTKVPRSRSG